MPVFEITYYPPPGEAHSPFDAIQAINLPSEQTKINTTLNIMAGVQQKEWGTVAKIKIIKNAYRNTNLLQVTAGNYRIYLIAAGPHLIVVHYLCRKVSDKARRNDLRQAVRNLERYITEQEDRNDP